MHNKYRFFLIGLVSVMIYLPTQGKAERSEECWYRQMRCEQGRGFGEKNCFQFTSGEGRGKCQTGGSCYESCLAEKAAGHCKFPKKDGTNEDDTTKGCIVR